MREEPELLLRVRAMAIEACGIVSVELDDPHGAALPAWTPGSHLDVTLPSGRVRQYSLCGDPSDAGRYRIAVLRVTDGRGGSAEIHEELRVGHGVPVRGPRNTFALVPAERYVFVAGGIGITPILPMVHAAAAQGADWTVVYGARSRAAMALAGELPAQGDVRLVHEDEHGRIDVEAVVAEAAGRGAQLYCCGPEPLLEAVERRCSEAGCAALLHVERFAPAPVAAPDGDDGVLRVVLAASGKTIDVAAGTSILEAVRAAGVDVPSSCEQGICGTCETRVLDGEPDHRDQLLTPEEHARGETMMVCVSRARTPSLTLDL